MASIRVHDDLKFGFQTEVINLFALKIQPIAQYLPGVAKTSVAFRPGTAFMVQKHWNKKKQLRYYVP
jgi:hypothetical protein